MTKEFSQVFFDTLLPPSCLCCADVVEKHGQVCAACWQEIKFIGKYHCKKCNLPFDFDMGKDALCQACNAQKPRYTKALSVCEYEGAGKRLSSRLKFQDKTNLAPYMAKMMAKRAQKIRGKIDIIAAVPLHYRRKYMRKYNQSALLAKSVADEMKLNYEPFLLRRIKATKQQTRLSFRERHKNVEGAFCLDAKIDVMGKNIILVDDVMTTGATLNACAAALKSAGAKRVYALTFARVKPDGY